MKFARLSIFLPEISLFGSGNGFRLRCYSSKAMPSQGFVRPSSDGSNRELSRRIFSVGKPNLSIVPVLEEWGEQGRSLDRGTLRSIMMKLLHFKSYHHALEVSMWMTEKKCYDLTSSDVAIRLHLIVKAQGIEQAEQYFNNLPQELKGIDVYASLLKCYAITGCVEKAEALMQKMRDLGFAMKAMDYNIVLVLYSQTRNIEKLEALLQEMEKNGIVRDKFTLGIQLTAYAAVMDVEGMDKVVRMLESDPKVVPDWTNYTVAATCYTKAGLLDKALEMLKKAEVLLSIKRDISAYNNLLSNTRA
ncbi:pentatricopeptide repeat-containing protein At2g20710, mitochondrial-like [Euphorbia lathyris]|uniref:pentatricopeptide repeat-containing protein At2g20710, mitochondrial-like n=1 Tax=Euphorbia lathyris TaxID=212925 RepID=UPI003313B5FB